MYHKHEKFLLMKISGYIVYRVQIETIISILLFKFQFFTVPPSSPTLLLATATSPSTFSVQWTASTNDGGSPITSYVIEYRDTSLTSAPFQSARVGSDAMSIQLSGLLAFVNYEIRVRGENAVGLSDPSNTISGRTHPAG